MNKLFALLSFAFTIHCLAQDPKQNVIDSLDKLVRDAPSDSSRLAALCDISTYVTDDILPRYNNQMGDLALVLMRSGNASEVQTGKYFYSEYVNNQGYIAVQNSDYSEALSLLDRCIKLKEEIGDSVGLGLAISNIGAIYDRVGETDNALEYYQRALLIEQRLKAYSQIATTLNNIAIVYGKQNNHIKELETFKSEERLVNEHGLAKNYYVPVLYANMGDVFLKLEDTTNALVYFNKGYEWASRENDKRSVARILSSLSLIHFHQHHVTLAQKEAEQSLAISNVYNEHKTTANNAWLLKTIALNRKDYKSAYTYAHMEMVNDSLLRAKENEKAVIIHQEKSKFELRQSHLKAELEKKDSIQKIITRSTSIGIVGLMAFSLMLFRQRNKVKREKKRSDALLLNILPEEVAEELKATGTAKAKSYTMVTVMFTDFKDFTRVSERVSAELLIEEIHTCFSAFDHIVQKYNIEKIKTIGDAYLCVSGLPVSNYTHAVDMLHAAFEIRSYMLQRKKEREARGEIPFEIRIGIHTGPVVAGIVGVKKYAYDIWGDTVNVAARIETNGEAGKVNISGTTYELVKDQFACTHRGKVSAKNKGEIDMYFVEERESTIS